MDLRDDLGYRFGGAERDGPGVKVAIPDGKDLRQIQFQFAQTPRSLRYGRSG